MFRRIYINLLVLTVALMVMSFIVGDGDPINGETIILEGKYQERNIYVANTLAESGVGYCTYEVTVNGDIVTDQINSRAFEIDLSQFQLAMGETVTIRIKHKNGCAPKILNPGGLRPKPTFNTEAIGIEKTGILRWSTTNEMGKLPFIVQQYKWNKWVKIGELEGMGTETKHDYEYQVSFTSGTNKFRVIQKNYQGKVKKTISVEIESGKPMLTFIYNKRSKKVIFSDATQFEIYDAYGRLVIRGYSTQADVAKLDKGDYYISYDNKTDEFHK